MTAFQAEWLLPITARPIHRGVLTIAGGRITRVGAEPVAGARDLGRVAILPAMVNAHTHLELSYLQDRIPESPSFGEWVSGVMAARRRFADPTDPQIVDAARVALRKARQSGTGLFGEVSNTLVTAPLLREAGMPAQIFYELTGFTEADPPRRVAEARIRADAAAGDDLRISVAPHAPYSVSAALFTAIRDDLDAHPGAVSSVHLGESPDEIELLHSGTGALRRLLESLGRWPADWRAPGCSPVQYLRELGFLDRRTLIVHGVQFTGEDLAALAARAATLISCPRSNRHVGVGSPPLEAFYAMNVDVAFGTDSLASAPDLNMFAELSEARRIAPRVPARRLLESATLTGARALGFDAEYGSLEEGKRGSAIVVRIPAGVGDVEEYLVSGVTAEAIGWLDDVAP